MMTRQETLKRVVQSGIIAVIRAQSAKEAIKAAGAMKEGGIEAIEITMTVPGALDVIRQVSSTYPPQDVLVGAGTVLDSETARLSILAGAQYIVSPHLNRDVVRMAHLYQRLVIPGAMSVKEVVQVMETGADAVKIFPSELFGPRIIRAIRGPLPQALLIPTGGVTLSNVGDWIRAGSVAVGVGGDLTREALKRGDFSLLTQRAREYVEAVREARTG